MGLAESFAVHAIVLIGLFLAYGVVQERLMTTEYGDDKRQFTDTRTAGASQTPFSLVRLNSTAAVVLLNRLLVTAIAAGTMYFKGESIRPVGPVFNYVFVSLFNVLASYCQYECTTCPSLPCPQRFLLFLFGG